MSQVMITTWPKWGVKAVIMVGMTLLYITVFWVLRPHAGQGISALLIVPVLGAAWLMGLWAGILTWGIGLLVQAGLIVLTNPESDVMAWYGIKALPTLSALLLVAVVVGRLRDLSLRLQLELAERNKAEKALGESQKLFQRMADSIPDLIYIFDVVENRNLYVNREIAAMLGYTPAEIAAMGNTMEALLLHPDDKTTAPYGSYLEKLGTPTGALEGRFRMRHKSGEWRWLHSREIIFVREENGAPRQILGIARDVTDQLRAAELAVETERLRVTLEKERELTQLKYRFMTTVSHEFRTPLASILSASELLERYYEQMTPARRAECVAVIRRQIGHFTEILDSIAVLLKEPALAELNLTLAEPAEICQQSVSYIQQVAQDTRSITFSQDDAPLLCMLDVRLVEKILANLLSNAIKFTAEGGRIALHLAREEDSLIFRVSDDGIGIPKDDLDHIFDTFHRAHNATEVGGTGLGLRLVRDYTRLHGGTISCQSEEGQGAVFTLRLPLIFPANNNART